MESRQAEANGKQIVRSEGFLLTLPALLLCVGAGELRAGTPPAEPILRPLPSIGKVCSSSYLPRLSGGWVFGCDSSGHPDRAFHAPSGEQLQFSAPRGPWGISDGLLLDLQRKKAFTPGAEHVRLTPIASSVHAPLVSSGETVVFSSTQGIETMQINGQSRTLLQNSRPAPWYRPALNDHGVFWVEIHQGKEEIHWKPHSEDVPRPFAQGDQALRHVTAEGNLVAWMSDTAVFLRNLSTGTTQEYSADVHSNEALALSEGLLCYEARGDYDLDIFCNNGFHLQRPGHQRRPSLWRGWLVFHEGEQALLYGPIK